jgi:acyl-CoA thioesterase
VDKKAGLGAQVMKEKQEEAFRNAVSREPFAKFLNMRLVRADEGYALCEMAYTEAMDNIHGMIHGGAVFSLIDEAFEISSNCHGTVAVALNMNVTYVRPARKNTILRAESREVARGNKTATYSIDVTDDEGLVAVCQALVYRKKDRLPFLPVTSTPDDPQ